MALLKVHILVLAGLADMAWSPMVGLLQIRLESFITMMWQSMILPEQLKTIILVLVLSFILNQMLLVILTTPLDLT